MTLVWHFLSIEIRNGERERRVNVARAAHVNLRTAPRRPLAGICARRFAFVCAVRLRLQVIASGRPCDRSKSDRTDAVEARARMIAIDEKENENCRSKETGDGEKGRKNADDLFKCLAFTVSLIVSLLSLCRSEAIGMSHQRLSAARSPDSM